MYVHGTRTWHTSMHMYCACKWTCVGTCRGMVTRPRGCVLMAVLAHTDHRLGQHWDTLKHTQERHQLPLMFSKHCFLTTNKILHYSFYSPSSSHDYPTRQPLPLPPPPPPPLPDAAHLDVEGNPCVDGVVRMVPVFVQPCEEEGGSWLVVYTLQQYCHIKLQHFHLVFS